MPTPRSAVMLLAFAVLSGCEEEKKPLPPPATPPIQKAEAPAAAPALKAVEIPVTSSNPEALATFKRGRYLVENARVEEGLKEFESAVKLDKKFPLALAYLGFFNPTEEGLLMLSHAASLASDLPPSERLYVEHLMSWRRGDMAVLRDQRKRLEELAPTDWRVQFELGVAAQEERNWTEAEARFHKALALNKEAGAAWNMLGSTLIQQGKYDAAVAALQNYAQQFPKEPTPHDAMGEALLRANKLDQAEEHFKKATSLSAPFTQAWLGIAQCHFLKGDYEKGRAALAQAAAAATSADGEFNAREFTVWSYLAEKNRKAALAAVATLESRAKARQASDWWAHAPVLRAAVYAETAAPKPVASFAAEAMARAKKVNLAGELLSAVIGESQLWKIRADLSLGKVASAEKSLELLARAIQLAPGPQTLSRRSHATGLISKAQGDKDIASQQLLECIDDDYLCRLDLINLRTETGDAAGAEEAKKKLMESPRRDALYLYVHAQLATGDKPAAQK